MSSDADLQFLQVRAKYGPFILSMKGWFTFVSNEPYEKLVNGRPSGRKAMVVGVVQKIGPPMVPMHLAPVENFWTMFAEWEGSGQPKAMSFMRPPAIPPVIMGVETDIVETGEIVAV